jgi:hypothetical protein
VDAFLTIGFLPLMVFVYDLAAPEGIGNAVAWERVDDRRRLPRGGRHQIALRRPGMVAVRPGDAGRRMPRRRVGVRAGAFLQGVA